MNYAIRFAMALAALCLDASVSASAQDAAAPAPRVIVAGQKNPSKWFRMESQHFIVLSDTSNEEVTELINQLEKLDYLLRIYTKDHYIARGSQQKVTLHYHDSVDGFKDMVRDSPEEGIGLYSSCIGGVQGFGVRLDRVVSLSNEQLTKAPLSATLSYLFEAYARHFLYRHTDIRTPAFYIDGFAQYLSTVRFSDNQMVLGTTPTTLGRYLDYLADHRQRDKGSYDMLFDQKGYTPLSDRQEQSRRLSVLSKSWLLVHYALSSDANRALLAKYLDLLQRDVPANKAFEDSFGFRVGDIGTKLARYRNKELTAVQVELASLPIAQVSFTALPDAVTDFVLAEAALKSCPDRKTGESWLRSISQRAGGVPNNAFAKLTLSRAQIDWGNPADALPYLSAATSENGKNLEAQYLLGMANLRLAEQHKDAARESYLSAAKSSLLLVRKANAASAEAAFALYKAGLSASEQPDAQGIDSAIAAWRQAHEVSAFAKAAALAYAYSGQPAEAGKVLGVLARNAGEPETAKWAAAWQTRMASGAVSREDLVAEMRRAASPSGSFREWTLASADVLRAVQSDESEEDMRMYRELAEKVRKQLDEENRPEEIRRRGGKVKDRLN
jgi:hypothetical protein